MTPEAWAVWPGWDHEPVVRSKGVDDFPYRVVYVVHDDLLTVVAVAHANRSPGCWRDHIVRGRVASRAGTGHHPLLDALPEIARVLRGRRDAGAFLELAADLSERTRCLIDLPAEFHELAADKSSSMPAGAARRLLKA